MATLKIVSTTKKPQRRRGAGDDWLCTECERRDGFATRACIEIFMPTVNKGKASKGKKIMICLNCKLKGVTTYVG